MSERRKKAPKIAWRDLMKQGGDGTSAEATAETPAPVASAAPVVPVDEATRAKTPAAAADEADASSPSALAARLDEAYAALVAETAREEQAAVPRESVPTPMADAVTVTAPDVVPPAAPAGRAEATAPSGGPPPEINIAPAPAKRATTRARAASAARTAAPAPAATHAPQASPAPAVTRAVAPALAQPTAPASTPAATPEAEVQRILARLATYVPVPRAAVVATEAEQDAAHAVIPRGPMPLEEDVAPLVTLSGLREAARTRRGRVELLLFRAGGELFALPLGAVEEAIEAPAIHSLPEMPASMLGVFNLRERLVPTYSPGTSLGVALAQPAGAALLVRSGERRLALAADDVEDVMELDLSTLRDPPVVEDTDGILLGVARFSRDLVGILDADALIAACLGGRNVENP